MAERRRVEQVLHPEAEPGGAIGVGRPDPAVRRTDLLAVEPGLHRPVERDVVRHDHVGVPADPDLGGVDPAGGEHVELADECFRVDHDARTDDAGDVRVEHARRGQPELEHLVAQDHGVTRVVATLVADGHRDLLGQEVGRLALALITPLEPDDNGGRHQAATQDVKRPPTGWPRTWIDCSLRRAAGVPAIPRAVGVRLTGRTFLVRWA